MAGFGLGFGLLAALLILGGVDPLGFARGLVPKADVTYQLVWLHLFLRRCPIVLFALAVPLLPGAWSRPVVRLAVCFGLAGRSTKRLITSVVAWEPVAFVSLPERPG